MMVRDFFSCQAMKGNGRVGWAAGLAVFIFSSLLAYRGGGGVGSQGLARRKRRLALVSAHWVSDGAKAQYLSCRCWSSDGNGLDTRNDFP